MMAKQNVVPLQTLRARVHKGSSIPNQPYHAHQPSVGGGGTAAAPGILFFELANKLICRGVLEKLDLFTCGFPFWLSDCSTHIIHSFTLSSAAFSVIILPLSCLLRSRVGSPRPPTFLLRFRSPLSSLPKPLPPMGQIIWRFSFNARGSHDPVPK